MPSITSIKLNISEKLRDKAFRKFFFRNQAQDIIAMGIVSLRKMRGKRQSDLARETGMRQSAVSRIEQAEYSGWSLNTLWRVAEALDARLHVNFEPIEDVIRHYQEKEKEAENLSIGQWTTYRQARALRENVLEAEIDEKATSEEMPISISSQNI